MYFQIKSYEKDNDLHEIYFSIRFGCLKGVNVPAENSNTTDFDEIYFLRKHQVKLISKISPFVIIFNPTNEVYNTALSLFESATTSSFHERYIKTNYKFKCKILRKKQWTTWN